MDVQELLFSGEETSGEDSEDLLFRIQSIYPRMSKGFKKISTYLLSDPDKFTRYSISQLAQKIGTHPSTITRYCQSLGFSGFAEFKYRVEQSRYRPEGGSQNIHPGDSVSGIKRKMRDSYVRMMDNTIMNLDECMLERAAILITGSNKIYFFGHGGSSYTSQFAEMLFMQIGVPSYAFTNPPLAATAATLLGKGDLAVSFSSSGNAVLAVDALKTARERGASTLGVTGNAASSLASYSDVLLCYSAVPKGDMRYFHLMKTAEMAVLGILQLCVLMKNCNQLSSQLSVYKDAFFGKDYVY